MKLKRLFKNIDGVQIKGGKDPEITGLCANSKFVAPGNLFIARKGHSEDGSNYIPEAIAAGASAILTDIFDPLLDKNIAQVIHPKVYTIEGVLAARFYNHPSEDLFMVGITGTNGKTTSSFVIKHLLDHFTPHTGLIGTIEYIIGNHRYQATRTTPDVESNHKMLCEMISNGSAAAVMEVTSHALDQNRVDEINFDTAVFTNLSVDHLDYHKTMENYFAAKLKLFTNLSKQPPKKCHPYPKTAVINVDSPWADKILNSCKANILTYGIDHPANIRAEEIKLTSCGTLFTVSYKGEKHPFSWPLVGRFNVYNCLAAIGVALSRGLPLKEILSALSQASPIPGRLEAVSNELGLKIYVDFAHSDDSLKNVLETLNELKPETGRLIVVFGCGGNRDVTKRPLMAKAAEKLADLLIITSDNPRNEDPAEIIRQIVVGFDRSAGTSYLVEEDRHLAIEKAIAEATENDIVLIAGKGHEAFQIFAHHTIEFDDRKVALEACEKKALTALQQGQK